MGGEGEGGERGEGGEMGGKEYGEFKYFNFIAPVHFIF